MRYWLGGIGAAVLVTVVLIWHAPAAREKPETKKGADLLKRGEYLVSRVALCGDCHTPRDDKGQPDRSRMLQGATLTFKPKKETKSWADKAPDITRSGLAGEWSEEGMAKVLTTGVNPEGHKTIPPMPPFRLDRDDARAVAAYLKSLPGNKEKKEKRGDK